MVVLGQGRQGRAFIREHYQELCRGVKTQVEIEVLDSVEGSKTPGDEGSLHRIRRDVRAYVYLWSDSGDAAIEYRTKTCNEWTLQDYLNVSARVQRLNGIPALGRGFSDRFL